MGLLEWWNFLFAAPLVAGLALAVAVVALGLGGEGAHGHAEAQGHQGHEGDHGHHKSDPGDSSGDGDGKGFDLLGWFGLGRGVSLTLMVPVLLATWGLGGLVLNQLFAPVLRSPNLYAPVAALGALLGAAFVGRNFSSAFARFSDTNRQTSVQSGGLVGCHGNSVFEVTALEGAANIRDPYGNIHRLSVRSAGERIAANRAVLVLEFRDGLYLVREEVGTGDSGIGNRNAETPA